MKRIVILLAAVVLALPMAAASATTPGTSLQPTATVRKVSYWKLVVNDQFSSGGVPSHWQRYDGPYGSDPHNCAIPAHAWVAKGAMRMVMRYRKSGECGAGWYSAGMMLSKPYESVSQKISLRFRVQSYGGVLSHRIIPMRWPSSGEWPAGGEEDYCEGGDLKGCSTYLHGRRDAYKHYYVNMTKFHTWTFVRRGYTVRTFLDGKQQWAYRGTSAQLPSTLKRPVLQQECKGRTGCPRGTTGSETIIIDWIKIWNPR